MANNIQDTKDFPYLLCTTTVTIDSGSVSSSAVDLRGTKLRAIVTPTITSTKFTLRTSADGTTYLPLRTAANVAVSMSVTDSSSHLVDASLPWEAVRWVQIIAGTTETAARSITLISTP